MLLVLRRHVIVVINGKQDAFDEQRCGGIARYNVFTVAALENVLEAVEAEFSFLLFLAVTADAFCFDNVGDDVLVENGVLVGGHGSAGHCKGTDRKETAGKAGGDSGSGRCKVHDLLENLLTIMGNGLCGDVGFEARESAGVMAGKWSCVAAIPCFV